MSITPPNGRNSVMALAPKYARLRAVLENSAKKIEAGAKTTCSEVADLQRQAIASVRECADIALRLAECMGDGLCPRDISCLHLGDWNRCDACFDEQVSRFFDQASKFMTAIAASANRGPLHLRRAPFVGSNSCEAFSERAASFTGAQQRVFKLLMTGLPNKLIAYEIGVSEATIKAHVSAVLHKLKVRNRAQAIALSSAFERNRQRDPLPDPPDPRDDDAANALEQLGRNRAWRAISGPGAVRVAGQSRWNPFRRGPGTDQVKEICHGSGQSHSACGRLC